jgi:ketosteroid isomerase-like protein
MFSLAVVVQGQTPLQDMVKTEQAFSKMAEEKTAREAFMAFIADDGLLFRPGAVNGKKWMIEHPVPPSDKKPLLAWQPAFAGMSASGDMGFTTGPWESKADRSDPKPTGYGHFVTVWKKQADGSWKFVVDLGISHPQSGGPQTLWHPTDKTANTKVPNVDTATELKGLLNLDRSGSSFTSLAAPDVRVYREAGIPFIGREASLAALAKIKGQFKAEPIGGDVSRAGDLGYTHGTYDLIGADQKVIEHGSYVRIWKKQEGRWRIVLDVINAH